MAAFDNFCRTRQSSGRLKAAADFGVGYERRKLMPRILIIILVVGLVGCATMLRAESKFVLEFRPGETSPKEGFTKMTVVGSEETVYISSNAILTNQDVEFTHVEPTRIINATIVTTIEIRFTTQGAQKFANATKQNLKKPIGILVDGRLICAPIVQEEITDGVAWIGGSFTEEEANRIADGIMGKQERTKWPLRNKIE